MLLPMRDEMVTDATDAPPSRSIFLTGASGALGRALACEHAHEGQSLTLWGRDAERLAQTCDLVAARGAEVRSTSIDLSEARAACELLLEQDAERRFDIAYLVAGTGETRAPDEKVESHLTVLKAAEVNYAAPAAMAAALAGRMAERGGGRIVLIGSAAGHHSLPAAAGYSGSKAGLARFADALRIAVKPHGVSVTLAAPGFLDTPLAGSAPRDLPFMLPVEEAARRIVRAGERGRRHYVTPWPFAVLRVVDALLPTGLRDRLLARLEP